jgi:hypothetical protein
MQLDDSAGGGWLVVGGTSEASPLIAAYPGRQARSERGRTLGVSPGPTPVGVIRRCDDARRARADRQHPDLIGAVNSKTREAIPRLMIALALCRP